MIELKGVRKQFGDVCAVDDIDIRLADRRLLVILGPSGSGKTTLLRLIAGLERPDAGTISLKGEVVSTPTNLAAPYKRRLSMIFQGLSLWPHMTVTQHLEFVCEGTGVNAKRDRILEMLHKVKLDGLGARYPHQLSGGERQRLAIARALITHPFYMLMDEPFSQLDFMLKKEMVSLLLALKRKPAMTIVYVTHNLDEAMALADEIVVMEKGGIMFHDDRERFSTAYSQWLGIESANGLMNDADRNE